MPGQRREPPIVVRRDGAIAWVVLNRPDVLNALSFEMQEALPTLMEGLSRDKEVRVLVLTGAGDQAFCAGADVDETKAAWTPRPCWWSSRVPPTPSMSCSAAACFRLRKR